MALQTRFEESFALKLCFHGVHVAVHVHDIAPSERAYYEQCLLSRKDEKKLREK